MTDVEQLQLNLETDEEDENVHVLPNDGRHRPPRPSALPRKSLARGGAGARSRRRSSARFLSIGGRRNHEDDMSHESLGKMYKQAIQMNAENRINASNSWNFKLIENIDKFLTEDPDDPSPQHASSAAPSHSNSTQDGNSQPGRRVNFTKASCTLDASVKIYSYRVDDVHLTSYRVLENLHRSDGEKKKKNNDSSTAPTNDEEASSGEAAKSRQRSKATVSTVETNVGNINLNKLDSAFDIDPLFHKMSKTFDEGGAKGLLLVNLGTSGNGCNIVFDSGLAEDDEEGSGEECKTSEATNSNEMTVDISSLTNKLGSLLSGETVHSLSLVPQLADLRAEFAELEQEGFVDNTVPISRSRRFAPDPEEEKEADRSIHQEVLERSRASMGRSLLLDEDDRHSRHENEQEYAADDFGGFDDDDDADDDAFDAFLATDDNGNRYSSISFRGSMPLASTEKSATTVLLDAISSGKVLKESEYEFFDSQLLSHVATNAWAGSAHWKPLAHLHKPKPAKESNAIVEKKPSRNKVPKERIYVNLREKPDLTDILRKPPKPKSRRANDPLQFTPASLTKYTKNENLLPLDAGIRPEVFTSLFLRPKAVLKPSQSSAGPPKAVGFAMDQVVTFGGESWDDGSFGGGDDDDGPGFAMSTSHGNDDPDEFVVEELEGVRKVDKISVGYATIAKKVDVKRLKRDLWAELESHLQAQKEDAGNELEEKNDFPSTPTSFDLSGPISFQKTILAMEAAKSQVDVTLPFYFICILHLANEKGLRLDSKGLDDFEIHSDGTGSLF